MSVFSERLVALMRQKGLTQKQLATEANLTESAMSYYAKGQRTPSGDVLCKIARTLNTSTDYLLGNTDDASAPQQAAELRYLQRNLGKLDPERLQTAEKMLRAVFDDIFDDDEE